MTDSKDSSSHLPLVDTASLPSAFPAVILLLDRVGNILSAHLPTETKFAFSSRQLLHGNIHSVLPATAAEEIQRVLDEVATHNSARTAVFSRRSRLEIGQAQFRAAPMPDGTICAVFAEAAEQEGISLESRVLEGAAHAVVVTDVEGKIEWVNRAFTDLTQYTSEEALGKNPRELLKSGAHDRAFYKELWDCILDGRTWRGEIINRRKDGTRYYEDQMISPLRNERGEIVQFVAIKQDVTAHKKALEGLARAEEEYRQLVNDVNDGIFVTDASGVYTFVNRALIQIHGMNAPADLIGHNVLEFVRPDRVEELRRRFFSGSVASQIENTVEAVVLPNGNERFVEVRPVAVVEEGRFIGFRGVVRDVDQHIRHERELRLSHDILSKIDNVVHVIGSDGLVLYVSPSAERILGHSATSLLGEGFWQVTFSSHAESRQERATAIEIARGIRKARKPFERTVRKADGSTRLMLETESATGDGTVIRVGIDITDRRRVEDQYRQAQKMEAIGVLAGGVAHDFNNLLTVINGYSDLLLARLPNEDPLKTTMTAIHQAGSRAASLTRQLLAFSRKQIIAPRRLELNHIVTNTEKMLRRIIGEDIELKTVLTPDAGMIHADEAQIEQILMNLAVNARDAMPLGGKLTIETHHATLGDDYVSTHYGVPAGDFAMLAVTDTGVGMRAEVRERIFEPFFTTKEAGKGTGLGLSVVDGIVSQNRGYVQVYSEVNIGTTFKIYLPRVAPELPESAAPADSRALPGGTGTILLAEDEDDVRQFAKNVLESCGYSVIEAASGQEAIAKAEAFNQPIHLVLTDVVMPNLGGHALFLYFARSRPDTRVLFTSGYTDDTVMRHGILQSSLPFLQKPFSAAALAQKVREVLVEPSA